MIQKGISRDIASPEFSTAHSIKSAIFNALEACSPSTSGNSLPCTHLRKCSNSAYKGSIEVVLTSST